MCGNGAGIGMEIILPDHRAIRPGQPMVLSVCFVVAAVAAAVTSVGWLIAASTAPTAATTPSAFAFREQSGNLLTFLPYYLLEKMQALPASGQFIAEAEIAKQNLRGKELLRMCLREGQIYDKNHYTGF